jgi:hypothetical protein
MSIFWPLQKSLKNFRPHLRMHVFKSALFELWGPPLRPLGNTYLTGHFVF